MDRVFSLPASSLLSPDRQPPRLLCVDGPPGSGKTRFLAREACRLAHRDTDAHRNGVRILLLAVSSRNARRLRDALTQECIENGLTSADMKRVQVLRLEDWLLSLLKESDTGESPASTHLLDDHEAAILLHEILRGETPPNHPAAHAIRHPATARALWDQFRDWQAHGLQPSLSGTGDAKGITALVQRVYTRFSERTAEAGLVSRSGLANRALQRVNQPLDASWPDILRKRYDALLVDEAQELSETHHALLARLDTPLTLAGNADLSIRSFRGASPARFADLSPYTGFSVERISLSPRYRADITALKPGFILADDPEDEALAVADALSRFVSRERVGGRPARWSDCAVLLRSVRFRDALTAVFRDRGIPFQQDDALETPFGLQQEIGDFFREQIPIRSTEPVDWPALWESLEDALSARQNERQPEDDTGEPLERTNVATILKELKVQSIRLDAFYRACFRRSLSIAAWLTHLPVLMEKTREAESSVPESLRNAGVHLLSLHQAQGEEFPWVAIPFLMSDEFPRTRDWPEFLPGLEPRLNAELETEAEEARLLTVGLTRATQHLLLSAHRTEAGVAVQPSPWYETLYEALKEECATSRIDETAPERERPTASDERWNGNSLWASLEKQAETPMFDTTATLSLSVSAIKTYMACPRQFYYRHLLRLPQPGSPAATEGSLTHRLLEVFNRTAKPDNYTAERLKTLIGILFRFTEEPDTVIVAGFTEQDARQLASLSPLKASALQERLLSAADDLERKGYFRRYANFRRIEPEKPLREIALPGLERCRLNGVVDALIQREDGYWDILDYKTFRAAYSSKVSLCKERFREGTLASLPDDEALPHGDRFAARQNAAYPADYQLPLYYSALSQDPAYQGRLNGVALQMIRPHSTDNLEQGAIRLDIPASALEAAKTRLSSDIRRFIAEPILATASFNPAPNPSACGYCPYTAICDAGEPLPENAEEGLNS